MNRLYKSLFILATCCSGCYHAGDVQAPNGYSAQCDKERDCIVAVEGRKDITVVAGPEVDSYSIANQYLIGHTTQQVQHLPKNVPKVPQEPVGYFIIDTSKDKWDLGMSKQKWLEQLKRMGINNISLQPTAFNPSMNK